jgi:uncharacterized membrane protein
MHSGEYRDASGVVRVRVPTLQWDGFVRLAFDEIRQAGVASPQVSRRLTAALEDLLRVAPPDRRAILRRELELLHEQATAAAPTSDDGDAAVEPDPAGIGSAAPLVQPNYAS